MTAVWVVVAWIGASIGFLAGWVGALALTRCANCQCHKAELDELEAEWRRLFEELNEDHGHDLQQVTDQLARADQTIDMLRRNDGVAFLAGQMLREDREEHGL